MRLVLYATTVIIMSATTQAYSIAVLKQKFAMFCSTPDLCYCSIRLSIVSNTVVETLIVRRRSKEWSIGKIQFQPTIDGLGRTVIFSSGI